MTLETQKIGHKLGARRRWFSDRRRERNKREGRERVNSPFLDEVQSELDGILVGLDVDWCFPEKERKRGEVSSVLVSNLTTMERSKRLRRGDGNEPAAWRL